MLRCWEPGWRLPSLPRGMLFTLLHLTVLRQRSKTLYLTAASLEGSPLAEAPRATPLAESWSYHCLLPPCLDCEHLCDWLKRPTTFRLEAAVILPRAPRYSGQDKVRTLPFSTCSQQPNYSLASFFLHLPTFSPPHLSHSYSHRESQKQRGIDMYSTSLCCPEEVNTTL